jgi:acyl-CoA reductase-like NAD-dependent aldehyde dehydrogenase
VSNDADGSALGALTEFGEQRLVLGAEPVAGSETAEIRSPYDGRVVSVIHRAGPAEIEQAIVHAVEAFEITRHLPSWRRTEVLQGTADRITARREELARVLALEAGKPIRTARMEVDRAAFTFRVAAEEARRIGGEIVPLDWLPGNDGRVAHVLGCPSGQSPASRPSTSR